MQKFIKVPHTLTLLFGMMVLAMIATWIVPQGFFETQTLANGRAAVVPGTFALVEERHYLSPWQLLTAIPRAFASAQDVIFFVLILGGVLAIARATGTVDALIGRLLRRYGERPQMLILMVVFCFALASSAIGTAGEYIPFVLILVALCKAMRLDAMTAVGMTVAGYGIGYGVSAINPFTVVIAQQIADLPVLSGMALRLAIFLPFVLIGFHHVWSYAKKVLADPSQSMVAGLPCPLGDKATPGYPELNWRHRLILLSFVSTIGVVAYGIRAHGWYLYELSACFIAWGVFTTVIGRLSADTAAQKFIEGAMELTTTAMLIGVARGISLVMEDGQILHTLVHSLSLPLSYVGAEIAVVGMLLIQTFLNFFIPSGSGQAYVTMPLMVPLSDLLEIPRQVAVLAYQFGDGFSNMIIPTNAVLMGIIGIAGVPYGHWFRFCWPLMVKLLIASSVVLIAAVWLGYGLDVQPITASLSQ
ncbi:MAG: TIGR00366 family protein [Gammaproteobacteria bacterium]|nr:TIGR00366 family protein [Gammaproteobacteria bacterium]MBU2057141.1 TIGR00366 family protein [Gammaproteobacteria bacterium]MBU2175008.1 TIGR00366 family protein [Gammaproteobacteria bacterium]MBU2246229.1 TIGR00366 family protein [Gammaproteobacteria bacterium]MBU2346112.1 TIGR00366 family protein [Gammaproteobacteria bacterium]